MLAPANPESDVMIFDLYNDMESNVRSYCRQFPAIFSTASGARILDTTGKSYIDFFSGAGTLNYGHNNPFLKEKLLAYIGGDGIAHALDMHTEAKADFLVKLRRLIFEPRGLVYRVQFCGPTGTNAIEAALKVSRKASGKHNVIAFTNAFHGVSLGSLSATASSKKRMAAGLSLSGVTFLPYDGYLGENADTAAYLEQLLEDDHSGLDSPAAILLETVQSEGGVNVASKMWINRIAAICAKYNIPLIVDEIQTGCGRTGTFFSFDDLGIVPDIVCLSKSISGFGLPMSLVLLKPELDVWEPSEHNGTFRGNNLAFVTAAAALEKYWANDELEREVRRKSKVAVQRLEAIVKEAGPQVELRGRGLLLGLKWQKKGLAQKIASLAFENGLIVETCGSSSSVLKLMPPLVINDDLLRRGLELLEESISQAL